jgi:hypothetical protein
LVERRCPPSQRYGSQGTRLKDCESSQANRGRNASKGDEHRHLGQHDAQEASAREKALRWRANRTLDAEPRLVERNSRPAIEGQSMGMSRALLKFEKRALLFKSYAASAI